MNNVIHKENEETMFQKIFKIIQDLGQLFDLPFDDEMEKLAIFEKLCKDLAWRQMYKKVPLLCTVKKACIA